MIKANYSRSSIRRHGTSNPKCSHSNRFILQKIRQHVQQIPFFENTEVLRRDVQVLDHILTMEIKTHFILNLPRPKITTANVCATRPPLPLDFVGGATNIFTIIFRIKVSYSTMLSNKEPLYITASLNFFNLRRLVFFSSTTSAVLYCIRSKEFLF
jgi:hypothetical protein